MTEVNYPQTSETVDAAFSLWNYLKVEDPVEEVYAILAMGCTRKEVAQTAGRIFKLGVSSLVISTGGNSKKTADWALTEAEIYDQILRDMGIPSRSRMTEGQSKSFGDNIHFTKDKLEELGAKPDKILGVTIDFGSRRWKASMQKQWQEVTPLVVPAGIDFESYLGDPVLFDKLATNLRVEFGKILTYGNPDKNFMMSQDINDPLFKVALLADGELKAMRQEQLVLV